jgi:hypothetical protein
LVVIDHFPEMSLKFFKKLSKPLLSAAIILSAKFRTSFADGFIFLQRGPATIINNPGSTICRNEFDSQMQTASRPIFFSRDVQPFLKHSFSAQSQNTLEAPAASIFDVSFFVFVLVSSMKQNPLVPIADKS